MAQGKKIDPEIRRCIAFFAAQGMGPAETQRALEAIPQFQDQLPSLPTIVRYHKKIRSITGTTDDLSEKGTWDGIDGGTARLVLEVLAKVMEKSQWRKRSFSNGEARWVAWVRHAAPGLDPWKAWIVAVTYWNREKQYDVDTADLDAYLALKPWESDVALESYKELVDSSRIQDTFLGLLLWDEKLNWYPSGLEE